MLKEVKLPDIMPQDPASQWKLIEDLMKKLDKQIEELNAPPPSNISCKFIDNE